jgi:hypothetical protein
LVVEKKAVAQIYGKEEEEGSCCIKSIEMNGGENGEETWRGGNGRGEEGNVVECGGASLAWGGSAEWVFGLWLQLYFRL